MDPFFELQLLIIAALQAMSPMLDGVMEFFSFLGTIQFYIFSTSFRVLGGGRLAWLPPPTVIDRHQFHHKSKYCFTNPALTGSAVLRS